MSEITSKRRIIRRIATARLTVLASFSASTNLKPVDSRSSNNPYFPSLGPPPRQDVSPHLDITKEINDVLASAAELANSRASKIMGVRNEQHARLSLPQFLEIFNEAWRFVVACEIVCQKMIVGLRGTMVVQVSIQNDSRLLGENSLDNIFRRPRHFFRPIIPSGLLNLLSSSRTSSGHKSKSPSLINTQSILSFNLLFRIRRS